VGDILRFDDVLRNDILQEINVAPSHLPKV
jgi:hypothetical protein